MQQSDFEAKFAELLPGLTNHLKQEALRLYQSGGIDTSAFGDEFLLPKIVMAVALENQKHQYLPLTLTPKVHKALVNLRKF